MLTCVEITPTAQVALRSLKFPLLSKLTGYLPFIFAVGGTFQRPRRTQLEIVKQLLGIASQEGATKTSMVYKANLNFKLAQKYLDELQSKGMIVRREGGVGATYACTERGREALRNISRTLDFMSEDRGFQRDARGQGL